ncbi:hypothetical protein [Clostridioides difficile]|uniref:hypothetical protein n=1 Tax=Clostridioides difficile TaxID=1496 RepID=UPI003AB78829
MKEPLGGAQKDVEAVSKEIKAYILERLNHYKDMDKEEIIAQRYKKFRNIGKCL